MSSAFVALNFLLIHILTLTVNLFDLSHCSSHIQREGKPGIKEFTIDLVSKNDQLMSLLVQLNATSRMLSMSHRQENGDTYSLVINFQMGLQIYKATMLGEADKGEPQYHFICFLHTFNTTESIPFDIFEKLFQEPFNYPEDGGVTNTEETIFVDQQIKSVKLDSFGTVVSKECSEAQAVYTTSKDIRQFSNGAGGADFAFLSTAHLPAINISVYPYCSEAAPLWELGCICRVEFSVYWYPCEIKLCDSPQLSEKKRIICHVENCKKNVSLQFYVDQRRSCFWN